ncbi:MAG: CoA ester lyase [Chloroflexi bacterium]|nr:CoA ester lyase [Chloroflexota bacterium]
MTALRSLLFVPGNRSNMLEKAMGISPDAYIPDMEDSIPVEEKENARNVIASFLPRLAEVGPLVIPRINSLDTGLLQDDLAAIVGPHIFGVSVGKIQSTRDIDEISNIIEGLEKKAGLEVGAIKLVPWIETAMAIVNAYEICAASPRIVGVAFGAEDFTNDMAIERTEGESEIDYPRRVMCVAARAADVLALDTPYFSFRDPDGLRKNSFDAKGYGFRGKFAIHPAQVDILNESFSPSVDEIENARRVIAAFEEAERSGRGSTSLDGKVIDVPVVKRARQLLESAEGMNQG